jgi:hypothetical protein
MKKIILISLLLLSLFIVGCDTVTEFVQSLPQGQETTTEDSVQPSIKEEPEIKIIPELEPEPEPFIEPELTGCTINSECEGGKLCIDGECNSLQNLYVPVDSCVKTCNYDSLQISTSDGETMTLSRGEGTYSYAGALEWKTRSLPDYCEGQTPKVALLLLKKNAGKILEETVVTLGVGDTTKTITHPTITRVQFKATLDSVNEVCS